jgi:NTE family protein
MVIYFSGVRTKLSAHIRNLDPMHTLGIDFQHIVGVYGGSIAAALISSGMVFKQIKQLAMDTSFKKFRGFAF